MKKTLLTISLLFVWLLAWQPASANGGTSCGTATVATPGINHSDHTGVVDQWFTYTATTDCIITITSCGLTTSATGVDLIYGCFYPYPMVSGSQCGTTAPYQSNLVYRVSSGEQLLIRWNSLGAEASYDWSLTEAPLPAGSTPETAIPAKEGINNTNHYGRIVNQWYTFTPNVDGEMAITNTATLPSTQYYFTLYTYDGSNFTTITSSDYHGEGSSFLTAGVTYYIEWYQDSNPDLHSWQLTFSPRSVIPGETCSSPLVANAGLNSASNEQGNQWFTYTPTTDGIATITTCGLTQEDTYVQVYKDCASSYLVSNDDYCGLQTTVNFRVVHGQPYLIKWKNNYTSGTFNWNLSLRPYKTGTDITSFEFPDQTLSSVINATDHTINVVVGKSENISWLTPTFTLSDGAQASVNNIVQESGYDGNDFTSPVVYSVLAEDSVTTTDWTVTVTNASAENTGNDILTYSFEEPADSTIFDAPNHAITAYVPFNQDVTNLTADFTLSPYASAAVGATSQVSGSTVNDFTSPVTYTITAEDATTQDWVVTVVQNPLVHGEACDDPTIAVEGENYANNAFSSQYFIYTPTEDGIIGLSYCGNSNKYYQINSDCSTEIGSDWMACGNEDTYAVQAGVPVIIYWQNIQGDSWHLTNYPVGSEKVLYYFWVSHMIGDLVIDSTDHTINITVNPNTDVSSLQTEFYLSTGATAYIGTTQLFYNDNVDYTNPVTLTIMAQDGSTQDWVVTVTPRIVGTGNSLTQFVVNNQVGDAVIDEASHTVTVGVVAGTDVTLLYPRFQLSDYATANIGGVDQTSGQSWVDFTNPVTYTIVSEAGVSQDWTVTVVEGAALNIYADITSYRLDEQTKQPTFDKANKAILVYVAKGTDRSALVPTFYLSTGAAAEVGTTAQVSGVTANDFTAPVVYSVTSEDGLTSNDWTVTVNIPENDITAFSLPGQSSSTIDAANKIIAVEMPANSVVTDLTATFTLSDGATAKVGTVDQVSGQTANDFTNPVIYDVTADDGVTIQGWTVTVTVLSGIADNTLATNANVFPNPSNGQFNVKFSTPVSGTIQMDVFSVTGAKLLSQTADGSKGIYNVDLSGYQAGVYYLRMTMNGRTITLKLLRN
ncbi:MAG TPA: T9SS type A sorting domain-containing protein [Williamwhitmania sp.]|nr:T9SS type A sorting domain-containing protein [Williamwhitmania sp.]